MQESEREPEVLREEEAPEPWPELLAQLRPLTDAELLTRVRELAAHEHTATALLVAHLAELDTRDAHLRAGYPSLFVYCREALGLAEHEAYNHIEAARAARRFPAILDALSAGRATLTAVRLLRPHLTAENHGPVLESVQGKRRSEVEEIVARLAPFDDAPAFIRRLPGSGRAPALTPASTTAAPASPGPTFAGVPAAIVRSVAIAPRPSGEITPLAPDRYRLQCTIAGTTLEKLRLAKDLLRHAIPSGDDAAVLDRAFSALLADLARAKFAATGSPRHARETAPGSRHIPAEVKRAVFVRDVGRCAFVGTDGRRCDERAFVEFHHVRPYAAGGEPTVDNIQLRCRRHNDYESRTFFGASRGDEPAAGDDSSVGDGR